MNHTKQPIKAYHLAGWHEVFLLLYRVFLSTVRVQFRKSGHLKVGVMLSVCVSETVPLGPCQSALDCLTIVRVYVGWIVHASQAPSGQICVWRAYICIMIIIWSCVCFCACACPPFLFPSLSTVTQCWRSSHTVCWPLQTMYYRCWQG